jgi:tetraacyldisaccharide 4'-kinase
MAPLGSAPIPWLKPISWLYGLGASAKNLCYDRGLCRAQKLGVPVVSIGNLCAGGTGKTPMVAWLLERYREAGLRVGVLARGYRRKAGEKLNDEGRLLQGRFPGLAQKQSPDRHAAGMELLGEQQLDLILLDDGFQHRRLHRDLDICLLDAGDPFRGGLLPSGWLREPPSSLRRADMIVATGSQSLAEQDRGGYRLRLPACARDKPLFFAETQARDLLHLPSGEVRPLDSLRGGRVFAVAGIARPERFEETLASLGVEVLGRHWLVDHGAFSLAELTAWSDKTKEEGASLVMTEKDEARCMLGEGEGPERLVLRIDLLFREEPPLEILFPHGLQER